MNFAGLSIVLSTHKAQFEAVPFKGDFEANLAKISSWGYQGVELAIRDPGLVEASNLESALARYGLKVPAIGTGQAWVEEHLSFSSADPQVRHAAVERIQNHLYLAKRLNAIVIIGLIQGTTPVGQSKDQSMHFLVECLQKCAGVAAELHMQIAFEPLNRYETDLIHTADEGLGLIHQVGSQNLGLLLDTFHMNIEEPDITESIRKSGSRIFHFHVADSNRWYPGAGHLDFKTILQALDSTGYSGWVSGEFMPYPEADIAAQRSIEQLKFITS
jgi:sugar phosphate isomerase/epimerase